MQEPALQVHGSCLPAGILDSRPCALFGSSWGWGVCVGLKSFLSEHFVCPVSLRLLLTHHLYPQASGIPAQLTPRALFSQLLGQAWL